MDDFQQRVETALLNVFDHTPANEREIREVAEQASKLRTELENGERYDLELTVDLIADKLEERSGGGPTWAWNTWVGSLEFFNVVPGGHQI